MVFSPGAKSVTSATVPLSVAPSREIVGLSLTAETLMVTTLLELSKPPALS